MKPEALKARKALKEDFALYAKHFLRIRTKEGEIKTLHLNPAQKILQEAVDRQTAAEGKVRVIILKARQQGLSTYVGGYLYHQVSQRIGAKAIVVTHHAESTKALFDMTRRYHENMVEFLKPHTRYSSKRELVFDKLDSAYIVSTAGGEQGGRGETLTHAHLSEIAFWPKSNAEEYFAGLMQAIPNTPGTAVFIESTANGYGNLFHRLWKGAVEGTNGFLPVFIPWYIDPSYREKAPADFEPTPEEQKLIKDFDLDHDQLQWRRRKIAEIGMDGFKQEYPSVPEEAFLASGRPVFNPEVITDMQKDVEQPVKLMTLDQVGEKEYVWNEHSRGELKVWEEPRNDGIYYIGADVGMGLRDGDWSVAQVLDQNKRLVASYRAKVHPDYFAYVLAHLGYHYNSALIIPESNNHGILTCNRLGKDLVYPYLYTETQYDKFTEKETEKIGFTTSVKTKPLIIDELRAALRDGELTINDRPTLSEMLTFIVTDTGKMEAEEGQHDDCVMSLALANFVHEGTFQPIEVTDDMYVEML